MSTAIVSNAPSSFDFFAILICPACKTESETTLQRMTGRDLLVCSRCRSEYPITRSGIPQFTPPEEVRLTTAKHEEHWDRLTKTDYERSCQKMETTLNAIDAVHLKYCRGDVLEIGSGSGRFLSQLATLPHVRSVTGLDLSLGMLQRASAQGLSNLVHAPAEILPFRRNSFDVVVSTWSAFKYVDRERGLREIHRVLKPGGIVSFDLINHWPYLIDYVWHQYVSQGKLPPRGISHEYILSSNMKDARDETRYLQNSGFRILQMSSVWYIPLLRSRLKRLGYLPGYWGSRIGYDTIFVGAKTAG